MIEYLGLGTYQIISEQTRLNINIGQISKGEIQNLEKSLQQQDLLLNELKDISKNIGDIKPVIDPATGKPISLQTIVDDSIRYYENQIAILSEDIDTIIELQKDSVRSQIFNDLGYKTVKGNATLETQLAQSIDNLIELEIDKSAGMYDTLKSITIDAQNAPLEAISLKVKEIQNKLYI